MDFKINKTDLILVLVGATLLVTLLSQLKGVIDMDRLQQDLQETASRMYLTSQKATNNAIDMTQDEYVNLVKNMAIYSDTDAYKW